MPTVYKKVPIAPKRRGWAGSRYGDHLAYGGGSGGFNIAGQTVVDTWGERGATIGKEKRDGCEGRPAFMRSIWIIAVGTWRPQQLENSIIVSPYEDQGITR